MYLYKNKNIYKNKMMDQKWSYQKQSYPVTKIVYLFYVALNSVLLPIF